MNLSVIHTPDSKVHGANKGPNWGRVDPGGPKADPMAPATRDAYDNMISNVPTDALEPSQQAIRRHRALFFTSYRRDDPVT